MILQYTDENVKDIIADGFQFSFDNETLKKIQDLSDEVGDPEYIRTPQFPKKQRVNTEEDWEAIRNFKKTEFIKKVGIDASIDIIRKHLNKMTEKTYDILCEKIINEIEVICHNKNIIKNEISDEVISDDDMNKIGEAIFIIASSSSFYSHIYAKLYVKLLSNFTFLNIIFKKNLQEFSDVFHAIEYYDPNKDYDKFCENNKKNEKRRALGLFYVNLMLENMIEKDYILDIMISLQNYICQLLDEKDKADIINELSELLYIMLTKCVDYCNSSDCMKWKLICSNVKNITELKRNDKLSISNKCIFKHMDILDIIGH
tara:strand:- start:290 stop:1237 length:948 start_codon:yes stop_codon:yes gene_type:complete